MSAWGQAAKKPRWQLFHGTNFLHAHDIGLELGGHLSQRISPRPSVMPVMPGHRDISLENVLVSFDRTRRSEFTGDTSFVRSFGQ